MVVLWPVVVLFGVTIGKVLRCGQGVAAGVNGFYFASACTRSKMTVVGASYSNNLKQCSQYALRRRGLALNFLNRHLLHGSVSSFSRETCLVFDCPEFDVLTSIQIDSVYDYYTAYARPMPNKNVTCIPRLGVFQIHLERFNYSEAEEVCKAENGYLADISNGPRSTQIGTVLLKARVRNAYIGLKQEDDRFVTPSGKLLECLPYRAWAPGEPRNGHICASLTDGGLWKTQKCNQRLPFVCELKPSGPLRPCIHLPKEQRQKCKEKFVNSYPTKRRWPRCGDPDINENTFRLPSLQVKNNTIDEENGSNNEKQNSKRSKNKKRKRPL